MNEQPDGRASILAPSSAASGKSPRLRPWFLPLAVGWTALIAALAGWDFWQEHSAALAIVRSAASDSFDKDVIFRRWANIHGGVYVPITGQTPPNPYLAHVLERDITTPLGKKLTLMNPAYMTRQIHELAATQSGVRGHITSLKPIRPENFADDWEKGALLAFERGEKEVSSLEFLGNDRYLRLMRPLMVEQGCLKCHASQGYKLGDIRGGISVSVPWALARNTLLGQLPMLVAAYGTIWAIGILALCVFRARLQRYVLNLKQTAERLLETEQRYAATLELSNQALKISNYTAEAANRAKSAFLANMSHEIRTPMTAILGYTELMLEENVGRATLEHVEVIQRNGKHLLGLINDILDLSKIEADKLQIEPVCCSPAQVVAEVVSLMRVRADAKHLKLETDLAGPLPETVLTDPLRLRQILVNLLGNAIKFTEHGEVRLAVRMVSGKGTVPFSSDENRDSPPVAPFSSDENREGDSPIFVGRKLGQSPDLRLCFDVTDTGIGMNEEQIGKLFKPFSQVDNSSTRKYGGTGLGLCISKRLSEALGGNIEVHSEPGKGSTFSVTIDPGPLDGIRMIQNVQETHKDLADRLGGHSCLPMADKDVCPTDPANAGPTAQTNICPTGQTNAGPTGPATPEKIVLHGRVLLAEDGVDNQRIICHLLRRAGAEVVAVENGQLALEQASAAWEHGAPFDVILMDMQMPVMDGYEATRQLRGRDYTGPIVALTARTMAEDCKKCLDAGCDDYLPKPFEHRALLEMAARHINTVEAVLG